MAPNAMTSEITCRCRDSRSMRSASLPPTPFSSPALAMAASWTGLRASTLSTSTAATPSRAALTSSRLFVPNVAGGERQQRRAGDAAQAGAARR